MDLPKNGGTPESPLVVLVRPGRRTGIVLRWLRQLLPGALLAVATSTAVIDPRCDLIILDADDEATSPLAIAAELAKERHR
jgi:hypothetical protein